MKEIKISNSELKLIIDDEDYERLANINWHKSPNGNGEGVGTIYMSCRHRGRCVVKSLASIIMRRPGVMFDHIDRNPLNYSKCNLREADYSQNNMNRKKGVGTTSKYKGVGWHKRVEKWNAWLNPI